MEGKSLDVKLAKAIKTTELHKRIYKIDRLEFLENLQEAKPILPMNVENLIFILNAFFLKDSTITELTPEIVKKELNLMTVAYHAKEMDTRN